MWLTTSTVGPFIVYRSCARTYWYYYDYGSTVAYTGTDPLGTGPVYSHGPLPIYPVLAKLSNRNTPYTIPFRR